MQGVTDFKPIVHAATGARIEVAPRRTKADGRDLDAKDVVVGAGVWLRKGSGNYGRPGAGWRYVNGKLMAEGGLALTVVYADVERGGNTGTPKGRWQAQLLNMEGASNGTAEQQWHIMGDGTVRLSKDRSRCLARDPNGGDGSPGGGGLTIVDYDEGKHGDLFFMVGSALESPPPSMELRYSGVLLGLMVGDSLASPMDGWTATETEIMHPTGVRSLGPRNMLDQLGVDFPAGHVTDRTSLALSLATSLLEMRRVDAPHIQQRSAEFFAIMALDRQGALFASLAGPLQEMLEPTRAPTWPPLRHPAFDPSRPVYDGGDACARAACLALAWPLATLSGTSAGEEIQDDKVEEMMREDLRIALSFSQGDLDASMIVARAARFLLSVSSSTSNFSPLQLLHHLRKGVKDGVPLTTGTVLASNVDSYPGIWKATDGQAVSVAPKGWHAECLDRISILLDKARGMDYVKIKALEADNGLRHDVCTPYPGRACDIVPIALWHFCLRWQTPLECLARAACSGGDAPTICSIVGALLGALHGTEWIPKTTYQTLTNGIHGREYAVRVGAMLHSVQTTDSG